MDIYTIPFQDDLTIVYKNTPDYMHPNMQPFAVVAEGYLSKAECEAIAYRGMQEEAYNVSGCGAETREIPGSELEAINMFARTANDIFWGLTLDQAYAGWLQTYEKGGEYATHMDTAVGQARKLTAVCLLTDEHDYLGGDLILEPPPFKFTVPRKQGTVVAFLPYLLHTVTPVGAGRRQTINLGIWGPPFK